MSHALSQASQTLPSYTRWNPKNLMYCKSEQLKLRLECAHARANRFTPFLKHALFNSPLTLGQSHIRDSVCFGFPTKILEILYKICSNSCDLGLHCSSKHFLGSWINCKWSFMHERFHCRPHIVLKWLKYL